MEKGLRSPNSCNFIEITLCQECSRVNLLHIFRTPSPKNTSGWLFLLLVVTVYMYIPIGKNMFGSCLENMFLERTSS